MTKQRLISLLRLLIAISMPFFLGLGTIRAIIAWDYPSFEYQRIAPDRFGFSLEERVELAQGTLAYMQQPEPADEVIYMLEELRLPGTNDPLYNEREIGHMIDVKRLADIFTRIVWVTGVIVLGGLAFLLVQSSTRQEGFKALLHGGTATTAVLLLIALFILLFWEFFFVQFHELLFPPGTWTFSYSDSLIRLFPEQFWFDIGVIISVMTLLEGIAVGLIGFFLFRRSRKV